jgi:putative transposase
MQPTATELRQQRGQQISMMAGAISKENETDYVIKSQSGNGEYRVSKTFNGWICSCPDYTFRGYTQNGSRICKHVYAVQFSFNLAQVVKRSTILEPVIVSECQFCHSKAIKKFGIRRNKSGDIQRFICEFCKRTFSINIGFEKMKHDPRGITTAMQLYFSGESLRSTMRSLKLIGVQVSYVTVFYWIRKYMTLMNAYAEKIQPNVSDEWRGDEIYTKISGNMKYVFALMDDETRYRIAQEVAQTKQEHDATSLFTHAKEVAGKTPIRLTTDGLGSYANAYEKVFKSPQRHTEHIREITLAGKIHNQKMERQNGEFRDREKTMRGLKIDDSPIITGFQVFHNFIRPHEALKGKTPAEACGIEIKGENKWKTLIENASIASKQNEKMEGQKTLV